MTSILAVVTGDGRAAALVVPPSDPSNIRVVSTTPTSVTLAWDPSSGAVGGYYLYRSGVRLSSTTSTSATWSGLNCDSPYRFSVQAYDPTQTVTSNRVDFNASTGPCGSTG